MSDVRLFWSQWLAITSTLRFRSSGRCWLIYGCDFKMLMEAIRTGLELWMSHARVMARSFQPPSSHCHVIFLYNLKNQNVLTANKCPIATARPIERLAEPPRSVRFGSQVANTVKTSSNVMRSSTRRPWPNARSEFTLGERKKEEFLEFILLQENVKDLGFKGSNSYCSHTEGASEISWSDQIEDPSSCDSSKALSHHVEQPLRQTQLSGDHHSCCDCRVNVSAADMSKTLHHGGNAQTKAQGDKDQISRWRALFLCSPVDSRAQTEEDKDESGQVFSRHSPPEVLGPDPFESYHYGVTVTPGQEPPGNKNNEQND